MTREEIIRMAREAAGYVSDFPGRLIMYADGLERFANLVAAHERAAHERAALAETQQEPVAWKVIRSDGGDAFLTGEREIAEATAHNNWTKVPLYASSPRRQWHGLTDDEIEAAWKSCAPKRLLPSFAAAIEAALKEKNA